MYIEAAVKLHKLYIVVYPLLGNTFAWVKQGFYAPIFTVQAVGSQGRGSSSNEK